MSAPTRSGQGRIWPELASRLRSATGESPVSSLHRVRIEAAKRLLEDRRANVDEITVAVGYRDTRSFSRLFKRQTGLAPRQYRERFGVVVRR